LDASWSHTLLLFAASVGAGGMKAVAGGGTFLVFPVLVLSGVNPVSATATCTVALWPGDIASVYAYRRELTELRAPIVRLAIASVLGGVLGACLLLTMSKQLFAQLAPYLLIAATLIFTLGDTIVKRVRSGSHRQGTSVGASVVVTCQFALAVYGGLFGAGLGILMLALFSLMGLKNIHQMNALKNLLGLILNGLTSAIFLATGTVSWGYAASMIFGTTMGAYASAVLVQRLDPRRVRTFVIAISWAMTGYYFWNYLRST
jgi:uncharacterized membrane protein YfcA